MDRSNETVLLALSLQYWRSLWGNPQPEYSVLDTQQFGFFPALPKGKIEDLPRHLLFKALTKVAFYYAKAVQFI